MRCRVLLLVGPIVGLLGCAPSPRAPLPPPPAVAATASAEPDTPPPIAAEVRRGAVSVYIEVAPFSGSDPRCRISEAGDEAWVTLAPSDGSEPVAKVRSGRVVELAPGDYSARSYRVVDGNTRGGAIHDVHVVAGETRPVRNAAERARRARFRPCEEGEVTAGCRAGYCVPIHFSC